MNLKSLRQHYVIKGNTATPKRQFKNKKDVQLQLGYRIKSSQLYICDLCNYFHITSHPQERV